MIEKILLRVRQNLLHFIVILYHYFRWTRKEPVRQ